MSPENDFGLPVAPNFSRLEVANACRQWGVSLWIPSKEIDGARLLWALAGNESSFGYNCQPRHEMAYCTGAYSHNAEVEYLTKLYGHGAHASYGPWQILLVNCIAAEPGAISPHDLFDIDVAAAHTVQYINKRIFRAEKAQTLNQIAAAYNAGDWRTKFQPEKYILDCIESYETPMPTGQILPAAATHA